MNKDKIIKESSKFTYIINNKQGIKNNYFSIYYIESSTTKYGITVPKKNGNAVIRNKLKRRIKNIIINNEKYIQQGNNYVIIIKKPSLDLNYEELTIKLLELMKKVGKNEKK